MMREIKFRAWDKACKHMINPGDKKHFKLYLNGSMSIEDCWATQDIILMQYTGLKDKNGKEIYEGDVVLFGDNVIHEGTHGKVVWHTTAFVYQFIDGQYKDKCTDMVDSWRTYEIIGNIYENPELI